MTIEQIMKDYTNDVRVVFKHFVVHPQTATWSSCAGGWSSTTGPPRLRGRAAPPSV